MSRGSREEMNRKIAYAAWPLGLVLVLAYTMGGAVPRPLFLLLDLALAVGYALVLRRVARDPAATALAVAGVGLFVLVGVVGPPTAREPLYLLLNAVALLAVAVTLLVATTKLALRAPNGPTVLAVLALAVGSVGYLLNLLARWAVVLSGAAPAQAAVEDRAWIASSYLRGLDGDPSFVTYLLVWFDLIQVTYLVLAYLAFAGLALGLRRTHALPARFARGIAVAGWILAALVLRRRGRGAAGRSNRDGRRLDRVRAHDPVHVDAASARSRRRAARPRVTRRSAAKPGCACPRRTVSRGAWRRRRPTPARGRRPGRRDPRR